MKSGKSGCCCVRDVQAERAIPVAASIAHASGGCITLLQVVSLSTEFAWRTRESVMLQATFDADRAQAAAYLARLAASEELAGLTTITEVSNGQPAQLILAVASSQSLDAPPVDLIILFVAGVPLANYQRGAMSSQTNLPHV